MRLAAKGDLETVEWLVGLRWPKGRKCPHCQERDSSEMIESRALFQCLSCRKQYGVFTGTSFEGTRLSPLKLRGAISFFWEQSNGNYEAFYGSLAHAQSKDESKLQYRWKGPISVRKLASHRHLCYSATTSPEAQRWLQKRSRF